MQELSTWDFNQIPTHQETSVQITKLIDQFPIHGCVQKCGILSIPKKMIFSGKNHIFQLELPKLGFAKTDPQGPKLTFP